MKKVPKVSTFDRPESNETLFFVPELPICTQPRDGWSMDQWVHMFLCVNSVCFMIVPIDKKLEGSAWGSLCLGRSYLCGSRFRLPKIPIPSLVTVILRRLENSGASGMWFWCFCFGSSAEKIKPSKWWLKIPETNKTMVSLCLYFWMSWPCASYLLFVD